MVRGSNPSGGEIFCTCPWGPPSLLCNGYRVLRGGKEQLGRDTDPSPPSSAAGHERVELYLYSPYGLYGQYRASVPVQGCTLPYSRAIPLLLLRAVRPVQSLSACTRVHFTLQYSYTSTPPMGCTARTEPQCLYKGALYLTVELYLYSPYGLYSLYRASVPVQGCTLPYSIAIPLLPLWAVWPVQSLSACTRVHFTWQ